VVDGTGFQITRPGQFRLGGLLEVIMRAVYFSAPLFLLLSAVPALAQSVNLARPPEITAQHNPTADEMRSRVGNAELEKDTRELAELCGSIRADLFEIDQGMVPKDLPDKLNRVAKLSKKVRQELTQ
jgi:hypothetical protein